MFVNTETSEFPYLNGNTKIWCPEFSRLPYSEKNILSILEKNGQKVKDLKRKYSLHKFGNFWDYGNLENSGHQISSDLGIPVLLGEFWSFGVDKHFGFPDQSGKYIP